MDKQRLDLYTDSLISNCGYAAATGLSAMFDGEVSHDKVTRFLSEPEYTSKNLCRELKSTVRQMKGTEGELIFDDTICEKTRPGENEVVCWYFDHRKGRTVTGINLLNALYHHDGVSIPVAFEALRKSLQFCDLKNRQVKRASPVTKNEQLCEMIATGLANQSTFRYVLVDSWFAARENFDCIVQKKKRFIATLKDNRLVALSEEGRAFRANRHVAVSRQASRGRLAQGLWE